MQGQMWTKTGSLPNLNALCRETEGNVPLTSSSLQYLNERLLKGRMQDATEIPLRKPAFRDRQIVSKARKMSNIHILLYQEIPLHTVTLRYGKRTPWRLLPRFPSAEPRFTTTEWKLENYIPFSQLMASDSPILMRSTRSSSTVGVKYHEWKSSNVNSRHRDSMPSSSELMNANSSDLSRSTRSSSTAMVPAVQLKMSNVNSRHRDSMASSSGASSVRNLIPDVPPLASELGPVYSRRTICRIFSALSLANATLVAVLVPLFALQSSVSSWYSPPNNNAGSLLLAMTCAIAAVSSLFTPAILRRLGPNWTMIVCYSVISLFVGVHIYPTAPFLIFGYILMGISFGPLVGTRITIVMTLASKLIYVLSQEEEREVKEVKGLGRREVIVHRLSRGLQVAENCGLIVGNIVTALFLWHTPHNAQETRDCQLAIDSMYAIEEGERVCGSSVCPLTGYSDYSVASTNTTAPLVLPCKTSSILAGVYFGCCVMNLALIVAFASQIRKYTYQRSPLRPNFYAVTKVIGKTFKDPRLNLLAPLAVFIGLEQGFMYADFTKSYIVCSLGVPSVASVFVCMGVMQSISAFTVNMVLQHTRRYYTLFIVVSFNACLLVVLLLWKPATDDVGLFYVIAAVWGACNAIWETLSFSLIVSLYSDSWQGAIAHYYCCRYFGLSLTFVLHDILCNTLKLYALVGVLVLATVFYTCLEIDFDRIRRRRARMSQLRLVRTGRHVPLH